ncbi:MAG: hypothetical protein KAH84_11385, partial [Thiomargarita sp.]|nr:hypothetical protein [Thiomargarita sp.]
MSSILTQTLFGSLLDSPAVVETTAAILERAIPVIREHFTLTAAEISKAYRDSCRYSFVAIRIGLESPDSLIKKVRYPNITREFARQVETDYFQPFSEQHDALRNTLIKSLKKWAKNSDKLFAIKEITEEDLSAFIVQRENAAISDLILAQMAKIEAVDEGLAAFLQFKGLLGDSVLFFFREQLRTDSRVQATQMALQQENILANLGRQQAQFSDFQKQFAAQSDEVLDWAKSGYAVFYEILEEVVVKVDEVLSSQQQSNSAQVDYRDGTVQYSNENQELLKALLAKWQDLSPKEPLYGQVSNKLGRALLSSNALQEAGQLFQRLIAESESVDDKALAYFNLFHVCWRQAVIAETVAEKEMYFAQALEALNQAISLSNGKYALHDINKYFPITKMLGAGGMGCVFLCENQNKLLKNELTKTKYLQVVVKCFWENIIGDLDTVFNEPFLMDGLASVPRPLECGYADNQQRIKPYFVMEYIDGAIDGEVWLEKNGCLDLMTG